MRIGAKPLFSFNEQALALFDEIKACNDITFSYRTLEEPFMLMKSRFCELIGLKKIVKREEHNRRSFTDPDEGIMIAKLIEQFEMGKPYTYFAFITYIMEEFHAYVGRAFIESFLRRHYDEVVERWCNSRESGRMEVNRQDCDRYHSDLVNYVAGKPTCAIIAIDEYCSQDWPDTKPQLMLVIIVSTNQQLHYKVKRNGNLHTVMPGITLYGDTLPPLVVTKRVTLDADVHATGLRFNVNAVIVRKPMGQVNSAIFRAWIIDVLIPYVDSLRPTMLGENEEAVLLMDNLKAHKKEETLQILADDRIRPVIIPPHSRHGFQVEDLLTFALLKQELRKVNANSDVRTQAHTISRLVEATEAVTTPSRNRSAFRRAAITSELIGGRYVARIDEAEYNARMAELFPGEFLEDKIKPPQFQDSMGVRPQNGVRSQNGFLQYFWNFSSRPIRTSKHQFQFNICMNKLDQNTRGYFCGIDQL
ncbi:MAG: hypothetical protein EZS28_017924 [Streblomastix strix]|uniref:DDE-1 domain-containing protein n=1 Tax=Streblomastix strix TaxID=222440 RepID=A0A5J4VVQ8_9EUKA|nr:MAG: hypothetical protein EZS28_017924 [Streblomastix strix]